MHGPSIAKSDFLWYPCMGIQFSVKVFGFRMLFCFKTQCLCTKWSLSIDITRWFQFWLGKISDRRALFCMAVKCCAVFKMMTMSIGKILNVVKKGVAFHGSTLKYAKISTEDNLHLCLWQIICPSPMFIILCKGTKVSFMLNYTHNMQFIGRYR